MFSGSVDADLLLICYGVQPSTHTHFVHVFCVVIVPSILTCKLLTIYFYNSCGELSGEDLNALKQNFSVDAATAAAMKASALETSYG